MPELSEELKQTYIETAQALKGRDRRQFMARIGSLIREIYRFIQQRQQARLLRCCQQQ